MQRITFSNFRHQRLVGHWYPANSKATIIMAHGFTSDKTSRGRFPQYATALNELGYAALAFDFSGCGESDEELISMAKEVDDLRAAIQFAKAKGYQSIALFGHSLGGLICLKAYTPEIKTMVLTGAPTAAMHYDWHRYFTAEQMRELDEKGYITETRDTGIRKSVLIDKQMLRDFSEINQQGLLHRIACPILLIHGDNDEEEKQLYQHSQRAMQYLPHGSQLKLIQGANHSFTEFVPTVIELATQWFLKRLKV